MTVQFNLAHNILVTYCQLCTNTIQEYLLELFFCVNNITETHKNINNFYTFFYQFSLATYLPIIYKVFVPNMHSNYGTIHSCNCVKNYMSMLFYVWFQGITYGNLSVPLPRYDKYVCNIAIIQTYCFRHFIYIVNMFVLPDNTLVDFQFDASCLTI